MRGRERAVLIGAEKGRAPVVDFNFIRPMDSFEAKAAKVEYFIAKSIGEDLARAYPNREWEVVVDTRNEIVIVKCPSVSKTKGYHLHISRDNIAQLQVRARKAAGEILERHNVTRGRIVDPATLEGLARDIKDDVIAPDAAPEPITRKLIRA